MKDAKGHGSNSKSGGFYRAPQPHVEFGKRKLPPSGLHTHQLGIAAIGRTLKAFAKNESGEGKLPEGVQHYLQDKINKLPERDPDDLSQASQEAAEHIATGSIPHLGTLLHFAQFLTSLAAMAFVTGLVQWLSA